jgi:hypothetical protein
MTQTIKINNKLDSDEGNRNYMKNMKLATLSILSGLAVPVVAETYFKEQFNDEVRIVGK